MKNNQNIKEQLLKECFLFVEKRLETVQNTILSNKADLLSETKSSAGDKHETGRAMIQLEMEKAGQQLVEINAIQEIVSKINIKKSSDVACLGSLIKTTKGTYFLAVSVGAIKIETDNYFVVSAQSPVGEQLLGKKVGDTIPFNGAEILEVF